MSRYEQLDLLELTDAICETAKRIADGEVVNTEDKLDLSEQMWEARRRMPANQEYGAWWRTTGIKYSKQWRAVLVQAGRRIDADGRPVVKPLDYGKGGEFSIERFAKTGEGWITGDDEDDKVERAVIEGGDEWYTPSWLFDALALEFDLDVAAPPDRTHVATPAARFLTEDDDGLTQPWDGLVWCNPPYSSPTPWADRMMEHESGMWLSHVPINGEWCLRMWDTCAGFRLLQGMEFVRPNGTLQRPAYWLQLIAFGAPALDALATMETRMGVEVRDRFRPSRLFR